MKSSSFPKLILILGAVVAVGLTTNGCTKDEVKPPTNIYLPQISQDNVLNNLQVAYRERNREEYAKLLANDFQFYFDETTRNNTPGLPVFWTRLEDSTKTALLFESGDVSDIDVSLTWQHNSAKPSGIVGREDWYYYDILDVLLDVDLAPTVQNPEGVTLRVEDQQQRFYFRKGKTKPASGPGDTLVYIVEWKDYGISSAPQPPPTFGSLKAAR